MIKRKNSFKKGKIWHHLFRLLSRKIEIDLFYDNHKLIFFISLLFTALHYHRAGLLRVSFDSSSISRVEKFQVIQIFFSERAWRSFDETKINISRSSVLILVINTIRCMNSTAGRPISACRISLWLSDNFLSPNENSERGYQIGFQFREKSCVFLNMC